MQNIKKVFCGLAIATLIAGCGGGSNPPSPPVSQSFAVTAVAVDLQRSADALVLPVDGLPATGATLTID